MCGGSPKAPKAPDPYQTAQAQYIFNTKAAQDAAKLNAVDQFGPFGSTVYQRNPDGTPKSQTVNLSPEVQQWLNSQFGASTGLNSAAQAQIENLPTDRFQLPNSSDGRSYAATAFGEQTLDPSRRPDVTNLFAYNPSAVSLAAGTPTDQIAKTSYAQAKSMFEPDLAAAQKQKQVELAQRGIPVGSEIYNDEMSRMERSANNAYSGAARQATLDAGAESSRQFQENLSRGQFASGEDARLFGSNLSDRQYQTQVANQLFNELQAANTYGSNAYQTNLSNELLERNQPYAEAAALLGTAPSFQTPSFMNTAAQGVAPPDYTGTVNNNYNNAMKAYQNAVAQQGSMFSGIAGLGSAAITAFSDENLKTDRKPASGNNILMAFRDMPVDDYRYKDEAQEVFNLPERRTGTMAQDWAEHFGGDGHTIDMGDAIGKLMAAVKALDKRTSGNRRHA